MMNDDSSTKSELATHVQQVERMNDRLTWNDGMTYKPESYNSLS